MAKKLVFKYATTEIMVARFNLLKDKEQHDPTEAVEFQRLTLAMRIFGKKETLTMETPWTNLPIDISLITYCEKHQVQCKPRKINDDIGYGLFCPECEKERES